MENLFFKMPPSKFYQQLALLEHSGYMLENIQILMQLNLLSKILEVLSTHSTGIAGRYTQLFQPYNCTMDVSAILFAY